MLMVSDSASCAWCRVRTAFDFKRFVTTSLVPESDVSISSCGHDYVAGCVIGAFETRDFLVHFVDYAVGEGRQIRWIKEAQRVI